MSTTETKIAKPSSGRLVSLDALRGFTMFWIIGADAFYESLHEISGQGFTEWLALQFKHPSWIGFRFYDLIFPTFLFIIGVSLVYSLDKIVEKEGKGEAYRRIFKRTLIMFLLGVFYDEGMAKLVHLNDQGQTVLDENLLCGVLQRLALCYCLGSILYLNLRLKGLIAVFVAILVGWWALLSFVPSPEEQGVVLERGKNFAHYIDKNTPPYYDTDPESLSGTIAATCSCLIGVFVAFFLKRRDLGDSKKVLLMAGAGVILVVAGYVWSYQFPIIKRLWTSTYVLVAGGYGLLLLAAFMYVIDVVRFNRWIAPLIWIGANPLTIYMASNMVDFKMLARRFVGGPLEVSLGNYGLLLVNVVALLLCIALVRYLYKRQIFIRI